MNYHQKPTVQRWRPRWLERVWDDYARTSAPKWTKKDALRRWCNDEELFYAVSTYVRSKLMGQADTDRFPIPACSSTAVQEMPNGSTRLYACLADYDGLVAVYRVRANGRLVRLRRWPAWIVTNDRDPDWRSYCFLLQMTGQWGDPDREDRARLSRIVAGIAHILASDTAAPPPAASATLPPSASSYQYQGEEVSEEDLAATLVELDDL